MKKNILLIFLVINLCLSFSFAKDLEPDDMVIDSDTCSARYDGEKIAYATCHLVAPETYYMNNNITFEIPMKIVHTVSTVPYIKKRNKYQSVGVDNPKIKISIDKDDCPSSSVEFYIKDTYVGDDEDDSDMDEVFATVLRSALSFSKKYPQLTCIPLEYLAKNSRGVKTSDKPYYAYAIYKRDPMSSALALDFCIRRAKAGRHKFNVSFSGDIVTTSIPRSINELENSSNNHKYEYSNADVLDSYEDDFNFYMELKK